MTVVTGILIHSPLHTVRTKLGRCVTETIIVDRKARSIR